MNNEKVYIEGYVVGFTADTTGTIEKQIQVSSGEIVSIDEGFIHKSIAPEKVKIPQFVADVIEGAREKSPELEDALHYTWGNGTKEFTGWYNKKSNRDLFARAWLDGYEVEKEKRYLVKMKATGQYLRKDENSIRFSSFFISDFTRNDIEDLGFGWVFGCLGIEIEEVEE